jgi:hypothetical protein
VSDSQYNFLPQDQYGGGASISGVVTQDIVQVGPFKTSSFNTFFGQILTETGSPLENSGVDGIFGLAYQVKILFGFFNCELLSHMWDKSHGVIA